VLGVDWPSLESDWPAIPKATRAFLNKITEIVFLKKWQFKNVEKIHVFTQEARGCIF
jgi:hypothetical protein